MHKDLAANDTVDGIIYMNSAGLNFKMPCTHACMQTMSSNSYKVWLDDLVQLWKYGLNFL